MKGKYWEVVELEGLGWGNNLMEYLK